ncbi:MAG: SMC-Scp complex subunit ScpB [Desulfobacteraceae bacterium 4572_88]|nr:MAG: SMC-Scp complex subunit ScpB [Desulfobacteraceae bacterium 4572_88]
MTDDLKNIIESLLFVSETPLTVDRIRKILSFADSKEIRNALNTLSDEYERRKGGFLLRQVAGGYQFRTRPEHSQWIRHLVQPNPVRLSKAALETLAIIAYKQPVIRSDIEHIRGVDSGGIIRTLLERKFIRILGRKEIPGRPLIYATTKQFLEVFDLKDLRDLPTPKEIESLGKPLLEQAELQEPLNTEGQTDHAVESPEELPEELDDESPDSQETLRQDFPLAGGEFLP